MAQDNKQMKMEILLRVFGGKTREWRQYQLTDSQ